MQVPKFILRWRPIRNFMFSLSAGNLEKCYRAIRDLMHEEVENEDYLWLIKGRAANILDRLKIPHPSIVAGHKVWKTFLLAMIAAAERGRIEEACAVMADYELGFWEYSEENIG